MRFAKITGLLLLLASCAMHAEGVPASFRIAHTNDIRSAALVPQGVCGFFESGEPIKIQLAIEGTAKEYAFTLLVRDEYGNKVFALEKGKLAGDIVLPGQQAGYYSMESDIYADGRKAYTVQGGFAVTPLPGKRDPFFRFGYGVHPEMRDGYKRIGCGGINLKLNWRTWQNLSAKQNAENDLEKNKCFLESGDYQLAACLSVGLDRRFMRTKEELADGWPLLNDQWIRQYIEYLQLVAPKVNIKEWHCIVELPSSASMKWKYCGTWSEAMGSFVVLARIGSRQLKKMDPSIKFIAGGNNVMERILDIEPIHLGDLRDDFDHYAIDAYTGNWDLERGNPTIPEVSLMKFYRMASELSNRLGKGKEIFVDECGFSIRYGAPFDAGSAMRLANISARAIIISKAGPLKAFVLYQPISHATAKTQDDERHIAVCWKTIVVNGNLHRVPLPGGAMYATAASELAFAKYADEIIHENIYSYIFTKPSGETLATLWNIERQQRFAWKLPSGSKVLNMYGRELTGKPLEIGPAPLYITIPLPAKAVAAMLRSAMAENARSFDCASVPGTVFVRSFLKKAYNAEIQTAGKTVKVKILPEKVNVFHVESGDGAELICDGKKYAIRRDAPPAHTLKRISSLAELRQGKPGVLKYPEDIRPVEALQPERCHFKSDYNPNGHNVSAKYWTGYDDKNFYLAVEVDDPIHIQRHFLQDLWRDDSLQFVLSPDDYPPAEMRSQADNTQNSEYNFGLALTAKGCQLVKYLGADAGLAPYPAQVTREGSTTRYEVTIPWSAVGGKARRFGFVVFDNNDTSNKTAPYRLEFSPGIAGGADSSKLKMVLYE